MKIIAMIAAAAIMLAAAPVFAQSTPDSPDSRRKVKSPRYIETAAQSLSHADVSKQPAQSLSHSDASKQAAQSLSHPQVTKQATQSLSHSDPATTRSNSIEILDHRRRSLID